MTQTAASPSARSPRKVAPPSDAMIEISAGNIDEGRFIVEMDHGIREAHGALLRYHESTGDKTGKVKITGEITIQYDKDADAYVAITHVVSTKTPARKSKSFMKEKGGKLLTPLVGSSQAPDQLMMFDGAGRPVGMYDPESGGMVAGDVVGRIDTEKAS